MNKKTLQIWNNGFKILNTGNKRVRETRNNCPTYCLSLQAIAQVAEPKQSPTDSLSWWDGADSLGRSRQLGPKDTIWDLHRERTPEIRRGQSLGIQQSTDKCRHVKKLMLRKEPHKKLEDTELSTHIGPGIVHIPIRQTGKPPKFMGKWVEYSKGSCL